MRLHGYLDDLLPDSASIGLVRLLLKEPSERHTVRDLARLSGMAAATAARAVRRLEDRGIVSVMPKGRAHMVRPNMKSYALRRVLAPAFKAEEASYGRMLAILGRGIARRPGSVTSAAVFGSTMRGEDDDRSDIDLLMIADDYEDAIEAVLRPSADIYDMFGMHVSPAVYTREQFAREKRRYFLSSVLGGYAMVYGKDLKGL